MENLMHFASMEIPVDMNYEFDRIFNVEVN